MHKNKIGALLVYCGKSDDPNNLVGIITERDVIEDISISVGSCSEVAKRIFSIERQLIKKDINEDIFNQVDFSQLNEISPITDIRSTHVYRLKASQLLIKDVVKDAINKQEIAR